MSWLASQEGLGFVELVNILYVGLLCPENAPLLLDFGDLG
jgi:hypothetical protein